MLSFTDHDHDLQIPYRGLSDAGRRSYDDSPYHGDDRVVHQALAAFPGDHK